MSRSTALFGMLLLILAACSSKTVTNSQGEKVQVQKLPADAPLTKRLDQLEKLSYRVSYEMTMQTGDEDRGGLPGMHIIQYVDTAGNLRQDASVGGRMVRQYVTGGSAYACVQLGEAWNCGAASSGDVQDVNAMLQQSARQYQLPPGGTESIAGVTAACYAIDAETAGVKDCFSPEGVPLLVRTAAGSFVMEMRATDYRLGVTTPDFKLPAEPSGSMEDPMSESSSASVASNPALDDDFMSMPRI